MQEWQDGWVLVEEVGKEGSGSGGGGGGGLIWGQSIDLPSLYLLPARHAKINGKSQ